MLCDGCGNEIIDNKYYVLPGIHGGISRACSKKCRDKFKLMSEQPTDAPLSESTDRGDSVALDDEDYSCKCGWSGKDIVEEGNTDELCPKCGNLIGLKNLNIRLTPPNLQGEVVGEPAKR